MVIFQPYFKGKLELNSKKSNSSNEKSFSSEFNSFFFALKARLQAIKFEFVRLS